MKKYNKIIKRIEIQRKWQDLKNQQKELEKDYFQLRKKCDHPIAISTPGVRSTNVTQLATVPRTYCMICRERLSPRKFYTKELSGKLKNAFCIDLSDYKNLAVDEKLIIAIEDMYIELREEMPEYEIGEVIKRRLEVMDVFSN